MKISTLNLPKPILDFLDSQGYKKLYPPQVDSIDAGLLAGNSVLVCASTASGKTLIATLAILSYLTHNSGKVVYLSPLRALASEKYSEFKKMEKITLDNKIKVAISTGDFENLEKSLESSNILVLTNEKMDSIIRHNADWIDDIGLVIADEIHLIGDQARGPTLEVILTRLKQLDSKPQIIGLSATVTNSDEIAKWLQCNLVQNDWRPVPLSEGICDAGRVIMPRGKDFEIDATVCGLPVDLALQSVKDGGQSLIFAETRARSAALATKACDAISKLLDEDQIKSLNKISKTILKTSENTELVKRLAGLVKKGVAFHHAGLNQNCRQIIETEFRSGAIRLISSTPTLAAGVNLPARRVVISSIVRYDAKIGSNKPISILEYKQLCGRAGRPQYDDYGESIIIAGNLDCDHIIDHYINGEPEPIESQITNDKSLRIHVLSIIVTNPGFKQEQVLDFFLHTLGGQQSRKASLKFAINIALRFLLNEELLVKKGDRYAATDFGKKTSKLYIDPLTATYFKRALQNVSERENHTFGFLHLVSNAEEFFPKFGLRNKDNEEASLLIENFRSELLEPISEYDCNRSLLALHYWISESSELTLSDKLNIESGDMHRMVENADWLIYCLREISKELQRTDLLDEFDMLQKRIVYGICGELVDLVKIKGIGRIRARILYKHGIEDLDDLRGISVNKLGEIDKIGLTLANNIKSQLRKVR